MAAIVVINIVNTNTNKINSFIKDADTVFWNRGFTILSSNPKIYFNPANISNSSIDKAIKMLKESEFFVVVKDVYYTNNLKKIR